MANTKISALTSATTPLGGTEVLPIVQSGATVKVATNDLTVRNLRANATTGILQVTGPTAGTTRVATVPDANWTAARTDAAQSFTGDQTLSTGNITQGTAAKGINFTANTPAAGMTSQLLNWYEQGTWTPVFTCATPGNLSFSYATQSGTYTRVGRQVTVTCAITSSAAITHTTASGGVVITGLPFVAGVTSFSPLALWKGFTSAGYMTLSGQVVGTLGNVYLNKSGSGVANAAVAITDFPTGGSVDLYFTLTYFV